ncbi:MAG: hypothetical protein HY939_07860 [Gammaproteobacteria bacterium]|nr:hypothetical protein [Gammaproteobacteria bacterium]
MWGARQTGKTSFLKEKFKESIFYDLLNVDDLIRFTKSPHLLREEVLSLSAEKLIHPIIIDEIQ